MDLYKYNIDLYIDISLYNHIVKIMNVLLLFDLLPHSSQSWGFPSK